MPGTSFRTSLLLQAREFYQHELGYNPGDARNMVDPITVGSCMYDLCDDVRRLRDAEPDTHTGASVRALTN